MRVPSSHAAVIALGLGALVLAAFEVATGGARWTPLALFAAVLIVTELVEGADRVRSRSPSAEPFRVESALQIAAAIVVGPWPAALVAGGTVLGVRRLRGGTFGAVCFDAATVTLATLAGGYGFLAAGGHTGSLQLLRDLGAVAVLGLVYLTVRATLLQVVAGREAFQPDLTVGAAEGALATTIALFATGRPWNLVTLVPIALVLHLTANRLARVRRETLHALETFANIVDERDPSTYRHSIRVAQHVDQLARAIGFPYSDVDRLRWAARLHDLGKVAVDASLLRKEGQLDGSEWAAMRRHPRLSARLMQRFAFAAGQARAVEFHHERYDGNGYYGISGGDLPLASHFLIVADSFDAMTTPRPFRAALSAEEALAEIERGSGSQFHPTVAKAFVALQRGEDPALALTHEELDELRAAAIPYRLPVIPGARDIRQRPELLALGGVTLSLVAVAFDQFSIAVGGAAVAAFGLTLYVVRRLRVATTSEQFLEAVAHARDRETAFEQLARALERTAGATWSALVDWREDGLGGTVATSHGSFGPPLPALMSWLVREAESGEALLSAPGFELQHEGVVVALPARRENSELAGFVVTAIPRRLPGHVELALVALADELGPALAGRPDEQPAEPKTAPELPSQQLEAAPEEPVPAAAADPAALEDALSHAQRQLERVAEAATALEATLPKRVQEAVDAGIREQVLPAARHLAELRGLTANLVRRLERIEGAITTAPNGAAAEGGSPLLDDVKKHREAVEGRLQRLEKAFGVDEHVVIYRIEDRPDRS
jgi:putative nucleotidyltransferase with HDIG domain